MSKKIEELLEVIVLQNQVLMMVQHNISIGIESVEDSKLNHNMIQEIQQVVDKVLVKQP